MPSVLGRPSQITVRPMLWDHCPVCLDGWIKVPLGTEVDCSPGDIVLDRDRALPMERGTAAPSFFGPRLLWSNGRPYGRRLPVLRLVKGYGHRQRTRPSYQVDQGSCTYPQGRSSSYESRRGQLSVESRLRPLS